MKKKYHLFALLLSLLPCYLIGQDLTAINEDGKTIYYNIISDSITYEVEVTNHLGGGTVQTATSSMYSGVINIPPTITYNNTVYTVTKVGRLAFRYAIELTAVRIPNTVTTIDDIAFEYCSALTDVKLPNSITTMGTGIFSDCTALEEITLPYSVTSYGSSFQFYYCSSLTTITSLMNPPPTLSTTSLPPPSSCIIRVPASAEAAYNAAATWTYRTIVPLDEYWLRLEAGNGIEYDSLPVFEDVRVNTLPAPMREGYTFEGWIIDSVVLTEDSIWNYTENKIATALWDANSYMLLFETGIEWEYVDAIAVTSGEAIGTLPELTRNGYTFAGWAIEGDTITEETLWSYSSNQTATALWEANNYRLTLITVPGTDHNPSIEVTYDAAIGQIPTPQIPRGNFLGWFIENEEITPETIWRYAEDQTAIASWSSSISENGMTSIRIFPNPATNHITIEGIDVENIEIFDLSGRMILQDSHTQTMAIDHLEQGVYFVKISHGNKTTTLKLVKQ